MLKIIFTTKSPMLLKKHPEIIENAWSAATTTDARPSTLDSFTKELTKSTKTCKIQFINIFNLSCQSRALVDKSLNSYYHNLLRVLRGLRGTYPCRKSKNSMTKRLMALLLLICQCNESNHEPFSAEVDRSYSIGDCHVASLLTKTLSKS